MQNMQPRQVKHRRLLTFPGIICIQGIITAVILFFLIIIKFTNPEIFAYIENVLAESVFS